MKPDNPIGHLGTLTGTKTRFQFDENSVAHLQSMLISLYEKPDEAVIREYASNAYDSHVEAGNSDPIDIYLPDPDTLLLSEQVFRVVDKGTGMSVDTITNFFSRYGASTKRETDEQIGMMGLGCKAGLAYTSQMTVVSVHEGVRCTTLVTREEDGGAALQVIDTCATNDPNGVEITVPVRDAFTFNRKAREFFKFWDPGTVRINDEMVQSIWEDEDHPDVLYHLDPDVVIIQGGHEDTIVMGGVPYHMDQKECWAFSRDLHGYAKPVNFSVYCRVPIGTINFTPSREALNMESKKTKETLQEINEYLRINLVKTAEEAIAACPTHLDAMEMADGLRDLIGNRRYLVQYQGDRVPEFNAMITTKRFTFKLNPSTWAKDRAEVRTGITYKSLLDAPLVVTGFTGNSVHASLKLKARIYAEQLDLKGSNLEFIATMKLPSPWLDTVNAVDIETIRAIVVPKDVKEAAAPRKKYRTVMRNSSYQNEHDDELSVSTVCWIEAAEDWDAARAVLPSNASMAIIRKGEESRRRKSYPDLPHFDDWIKTEYVIHRKCLTRRIAFWASEDHGDIATCQWFEKITVDDPDVMMLIDLWKTQNDTGAEVSWWGRYATLYRDRDTVTLPIPDFKGMSAPLLALVNRVFTNHPILRYGYNLRGAVKEYVNERYLLRSTLLHLHPMTY